ncbi:MAG: hypothetical protein FJ095_10635 [Deltaproteobacteria bacterium]|nr:hypothetical protein [Deltaproteobacteria bacterium]
MKVPLEPSSTAPNRTSGVYLNVGPVDEREGGRVVRAGVLALADGLVAPRSFWELLQVLAVRAEWLRATFALTSTQTCFGVARSDGVSPVAGLRGTLQSTPRPTLLVAGKNLVSEETLESDLAACFSTALGLRDDDPFPHRQPGDRWLSFFWERAC